MAKLLAFTPDFSIRVTQTLGVFQPDEVHRVTGTSRIPVGAGVDIANTVRALGQDAEIGGFLGRVNGHFVQRHFDSQNLIGHYVWCDGEVGCSVVVEEADGRNTRIDEEPMAVSPEQVGQWQALLASLNTQFDWISLSGGLPPGAPADLYVALCAAVSPAKLAITLHGTPPEVLTRQQADLLCVDWSADGLRIGAQSACKELHDQGNRRVVIHLNDQEAIGCNDQHCWHVQGLNVINVTNDGDRVFHRMVGGVIASLMDGQSFDAALRLGLAASSQQGAFCRPILEALPAKVRVEILA